MLDQHHSDVVLTSQRLVSSCLLLAWNHIESLGRTKCPFYTVEHRETTKIFHLMCHQMPFWCGIRCKTVWKFMVVAAFGPSPIQSTPRGLEIGCNVSTGVDVSQNAFHYLSLWLLSPIRRDKAIVHRRSQTLAPQPATFCQTYRDFGVVLPHLLCELFRAIFSQFLSKFPSFPWTSSH